MRKKSDLRTAQQRTVTRLYEGIWVDGDYTAAQCVLPMGAGKTASALTAFKELKDDGFATDMFVLAPKRVAQLVWPAETKLWEHLYNLKVVLVSGTEAQRLKALATPADVYAIGVDNTQWFVEWIKKQRPVRFARSILAIDELSRFKNPRGKRAKALFPMVGLFLAAWGLTGTPRPNGYEDQFMPMKLLTRGKLWGRSFDRWRQRFFYPTDYMQYDWEVHRELEPQLIEDINKVTITLRAEDMPDLPELNDGPEHIVWVDMPDDVKPVYDRMKRHLVAEIRKGIVAAANMAVASGKLAQITQGFLYERTGSTEAEHLHDVKLDALIDLIEEAGGESVFVTYDFKEDLARLQKQWPGLPYFGKSDKADAEIEREWNLGKLPICAGHWASIGHGLNLQHGGHQLIPYNMTWSAELYDQVIKRFHRPGQHWPVWVRPILMRGSITDDLKLARVHGKMTDQAAFQRLLQEV